MHDLKAIRSDPETFDRGMERRGLSARSAEIQALDRDRRAAQTELQALQAERNEVSRQIGALKAKKEPAEAQMGRVAAIKERVAELEAEDRRLGEAVDSLLSSLPNIPSPDV